MKQITQKDHDNYVYLLSMLSKFGIRTNLSLQVKIDYPLLSFKTTHELDFSDPIQTYYIHTDKESQYGGPI